MRRRCSGVLDLIILSLFFISHEAMITLDVLFFFFFFLFPPLGSDFERWTVVNMVARASLYDEKSGSSFPFLTPCSDCVVSSGCDADDH